MMESYDYETCLRKILRKGVCCSRAKLYTPLSPYSTYPEPICHAPVKPFLWSYVSISSEMKKSVFRKRSKASIVLHTVAFYDHEIFRLTYVWKPTHIPIESQQIVYISLIFNFFFWRVVEFAKSHLKLLLFKSISTPFLYKARCSFRYK